MVVLFADIVGCSEISNHKKLADYNEFLNHFHIMFDTVASQHRSTWYEKHEQQYFQSSTRGDEGCVMIFVPGRASRVPEDVDAAINIALDLKRRWLLTEENTDRIRGPGLLPEELAIGIHLGKAYINKEGPRYRPEGYAINLTKRIESASREGQFTRIFVSEAARGQLELLHDEATYTFGPARSIQAKGISHGICVFEVKHHFLPTDWSDLRDIYPRTRALDYRPEEDEVELAWQAHQENPTNLWLAEEFVVMKLLYEYHRLEKARKLNNTAAVKGAYEQAEQVLRRLAAGDHRDAALLAMRGFVVGEYKDYDGEQRLYKDALKLDDQYAEAHWYLGYSISRQLYDELKTQGRARAPFSELTADQQKRVHNSKTHYRNATELNPFQTWMRYDLGCELSRWGESATELAEATEVVARAVQENPRIAPLVKTEEYLDPIREQLLNDPRLTAWLQ